MLPPRDAVREAVLNGWGNGMTNMIRACQETGVPRLRFTLRPDETEVTFAIGIDEASTARQVPKDIPSTPTDIQTDLHRSQESAPRDDADTVSAKRSSPQKTTFKDHSIAAANRPDLTSTDEYVLKVIETNGRVTAPRIAEVLGVSESTVRRSFRKLREFELIERIGSNKAGYWRLID